MNASKSHPIRSLLLLLLVAGLLFAGFVYSGIYNFGADAPHTGAVHVLLETMRERSVETRAEGIEVPDLSAAETIRQGAGNYAAMCTGCHLAPGMADTELSRGLYPAPPALTTHAVDPREAFWVIKHGIKASGMPAWGHSMDDEYVWGMVAFLQQLPSMDRPTYDALVASSGGHAHGGGESGGDHHGNESGDAGNHHDDADMHGGPHHPPMESMILSDESPAAGNRTAGGTTHLHSDGKVHVHAPDPADGDADATAPPQKPTHDEQPHAH